MSLDLYSWLLETDILEVGSKFPKSEVFEDKDHLIETDMSQLTGSWSWKTEIYPVVRSWSRRTEMYPEVRSWSPESVVFQDADYYVVADKSQLIESWSQHIDTKCLTSAA